MEALCEGGSITKKAREAVPQLRTMNYDLNYFAPLVSEYYLASYITRQLSETTAKKQDPAGPHNTKRACTILLFAKKIKFFISISHKHLAIFVNRKIENFRTKRASLCKGWGDYVFFVKIKKEQKRGGASRPNLEFRISTVRLTLNNILITS